MNKKNVDVTSLENESPKGKLNKVVNNSTIDASNVEWLIATDAMEHLDEANLDRFSNFLQEYARNTQFIVVTHRKGTMQAADVMHGVTVEDSGVSKVISVKIDDF